MNGLVLPSGIRPEPMTRGRLTRRGLYARITAMPSPPEIGAPAQGLLRQPLSCSASRGGRKAPAATWEAGLSATGSGCIDPEDVPEPAEAPGMEMAQTAQGVTQDAPEWRISGNGKHYKINTETGEITKGNIGQTKWDSPSAQGSRRDKVEDAMREIANGRPEATVRGLRNDLEQYGGTNDVIIIRGDEKRGLYTSSSDTGATVSPRCSKR